MRFALAFIFSLFCLSGLRAEDAAAKTQAPAGKEETLTGILGKSDASASMASLRVATGDKTNPTKTYFLWADGEVAKQITELLKKKGKVEVTGTLARDGLNMKVASIAVVKDEKK